MRYSFDEPGHTSVNAILYLSQRFCHGRVSKLHVVYHSGLLTRWPERTQLDICWLEYVVIGNLCFHDRVVRAWFDVRRFNVADAERHLLSIFQPH